jgi:hypothetical protein
MPDKKGRFTLADLDPNSLFQWLKASRVSPIGQIETAYPDGSDASNFIGRMGAVAYTSPDGSAFTQAAFDDPKIVTHERIHQGQLALQNQPNPQQVMATLPIGAANPGDGTLNTGYGYGPHEAPAYAFSSPSQEISRGWTDSGGRFHPFSPDYVSSQVSNQATRQQKFNAYINTVAQTNPQGVNKILAVAPDDLRKGYIESGPLVPKTPTSLIKLMTGGQ